MKRIAILLGLALLADVEPVLAQGARGWSHAAGAGRPSIAGYAGQTPVGYVGRPAVHQGSGRHGGHHPGHRPGHHGHNHQGHHLHIGVGFPWWWHHHHHVRRTIVVPAPVYVPIYTPVPVPVHVEPGSDLRYFCPDYRDYYPNVASCPSQWLQVVPGTLGTSY
jgi:hypothetical protein